MYQVQKNLVGLKKNDHKKKYGFFESVDRLKKACFYGRSRDRSVPVFSSLLFASVLGPYVREEFKTGASFRRMAPETTKSNYGTYQDTPRTVARKIVTGNRSKCEKRNRPSISTSRQVNCDVSCPVEPIQGSDLLPDKPGVNERPNFSPEVKTNTEFIKLDTDAKAIEKQWQQHLTLSRVLSSQVGVPYKTSKMTEFTEEKEQEHKEIREFAPISHGRSRDPADTCLASSRTITLASSLYDDKFYFTNDMLQNIKAQLEIDRKVALLLFYCKRLAEKKRRGALEDKLKKKLRETTKEINKYTQLYIKCAITDFGLHLKELQDFLATQESKGKLPPASQPLLLEKQVSEVDEKFSSLYSKLSCIEASLKHVQRLKEQFGKMVSLPLEGPITEILGSELTKLNYKIMELSVGLELDLNKLQSMNESGMAFTTTN